MNMITRKPGRPPSNHKKVMLSVKLPPWLIEKLKDKQSRQGMSQSGLIETALIKLMDWQP